MVTFRAGRVVLIALLAGLAAACSREQEDWRSAEGANSPEGWQRFLDQHPDSELVNLARTRIAQLEVQRDFQNADRAGTIEAYRNFLARHPSGLWSEKARIRIEAFSLGSAPRIAPPTEEETAAVGSSAVRALRLATAGGATVEGAAAASGMEATQADAGRAPATEGAQPEPGTGRAVPGEAAQPESDPVVKPASAEEVGAQNGYGVQLGAFGSEASADREWRRLRGRFGPELGNLSPRVVVAQTDAGELYRLQAPADGEAQARAICDSLREQEQACVTVVPR